MATIFYLPKVVSLPGSKLYFYNTGTSTPQTVYLNQALTIAHAWPVEADAAGVFDPIYIDPTQPPYRVSHYTSEDVLIYTVDGVPSNQNVQQLMRLESENPSLLLFDTDGTNNSRKYWLKVNANEFLLQVSNDNESSFTTLLSGEDGVLDLALESTIKDSGGNSNVIAEKISASFVGTLTGLTTSPTTTIRYHRVGGLVRLNWSAQSATSNATSLTITGLPAAITPVNTSPPELCRVIDNGTTQLGTASVTSLGVITFGVGATAGSFTNSGTKGFPAGGIVYQLD